MRGIRITAKIIAGIFLFFGCIPLFFYGHLNSGSIALVLFGGLVLCLSFLWDRFSGNKGVRIARNVVTLFLLVCFVCAFIISGFIVWFGYIRTPESHMEGTVVVLGCKIHGDKPSLMLKARLDAAFDYLQQNPNTSVIVTGGMGDDEIYSEAYVMKQYLVERGIDESRIYCEDRSKDTAQNIAYASKIIEEQGLPETMFIATDGFHEFRGFLYARKNNTTAYALPVHDFTWDTLSIYPEYWVREILGVLHFTFLE